MNLTRTIRLDPCLPDPGLDGRITYRRAVQSFMVQHSIGTSEVDKRSALLRRMVWRMEVGRVGRPVWFGKYGEVPESRHTWRTAGNGGCDVVMGWCLGVELRVRTALHILARVGYGSGLRTASATTVDCPC